ncbi:OmpA family protein [Natroniella sulfidigena]|uniref:OmpA/MotB family protein n=1 Tax=Natroniella sulfidigena TaxID=723921 RepID=UPI00200A9033|nr:flagellar motor protein MotB [Natroniella sulfidigena]MCK8816522.1 OmpA family protein [Natroniella sulfidigena]
MPRRKRDEEEQGGSNWLTTYGDMMTLLLAFFVLLYSFAEVDVQKFEMAIQGFQGSLGIMDGGRTISRSELIDAGMTTEELGAEQMDEFYEQVAGFIAEEGLEEDVRLEITDRGLTIHFTGKVLFPLGEAEIRDSAYDILEKIAGFIKTVPNEIAIEGHTDNLPISNPRFPSNWELSTTRATNVVRYFIEEQEVNPERLFAAGYSKYKPIEPNDTPENRELNRRVDIIILRADDDEINGGI